MHQKRVFAAKSPEFEKIFYLQFGKESGQSEINVFKCIKLETSDKFHVKHLHLLLQGLRLINHTKNDSSSTKYKLSKKRLKDP